MDKSTMFLTLFQKNTVPVQEVESSFFNTGSAGHSMCITLEASHQ
ncbi:hypothetical protein PAECIP111892_05463 [Paenibacillus auburnensis]|jgi:hypothetical protein|uniref:Uncharacterized protein n=1 Tax=Paenibacillus auburnensis TaxID=2905649 RepID=A0ABM9CTV9_9BACL|nr:hypothetical protein [Paenibacillus auburnensis]CAH1224289.1 hypothetical protein PAECIP111892_05463 [Paenibacillus auburnensis]